jgi:hypothetical protein
MLPRARWCCINIGGRTHAEVVDYLLPSATSGPGGNSRELLKHRPLILNPRNGFRSVDVLNGETEGSTYKYCSIGSSPTVT